MRTLYHHRMRDGRRKRYLRTRYGRRLIICETIPESEVRNNLHCFFRTPHGKRETVEVYRGFLIVRCTVECTGARPERHTAIYAYVYPEKDVHCCATGSDGGLSGARHLVDRMLETGMECGMYGEDPKECNKCPG